LKIVGLDMRTIAREVAVRHYAEHEGKPFYDGLIDYITSGPVVLMVLEGPNAVAVTRSTMGKTNPVEAAPGTIRGDLGLMTGRNLIHGSDAPESAEREIGLFFAGRDLPSWERDSDRWVLE
jgi:nucleoside-diphosphate kinase